MRKYKFIVFGAVLVLVVVFASIFWGDLIFNQQELANIPMGDYTPEDASPAVNRAYYDDYDSIEKDLNDIDVEGVDSDSAEIEAELSGL